jgi:putative ABC transport system permease protein
VVSTDVFLLDRQLANQGDSWDAAGLDPAASRGTLDLDVRAGSLQALRGDSIAVSDTIAHHRVGLGTVLDARLADATPARLRVVAIYRRSNGLGDVVLPRRLALAHAVAPLDAAVYVTGGNDREVARGLEAIVRAVPSAVIRSRVAYLADVKAQDQENARSQWVVVVLMILIAAMAAFNTGAMAAAERRHELVLARLSGATRGQVIGATALESLLTTLAGIGIGVAVVLVSLSGAPNDPRGGMLVIPWGQAGLVLGGALALGLLGTLLPAAFVGRARLTALAGLRG